VGSTEISPRVVDEGLIRRMTLPWHVVT